MTANAPSQTIEPPAGNVAPIRLAGLTKRYSEDVLAVDNLDLSVEHGQVFGLLGPNGAGKTTVLRMLLGLVRPTSGQAYIFGRAMRSGDPVLRRVGALVEGPAFVPHLSGIANLQMFWRAGGQSMREANLDEALAIAGLGSAIDRKVRTYSKGMTQRLALAQCLLGRPELLVLDEPTVGLDPQEMREIRALVRDVAAGGATVLLSSHILAEVEQVCTHAAVMDQGRLVATGSVAELTAAGSSVYLELDDLEAGLRVIEGLPGVERVTREPPGLSLRLSGIERRTLVAALVNAGIGVETVTSRHNLEDAFFEMLGRHMTGVELSKQFFRLRTYLALGLMMAIPTLITLAFRFGSGGHDRGPLDLFDLARRSGLNLPIATLIAPPMTGFLLPVVVVIFAGGAVAEEGAWGSLRYLLLRPVSRSSLLASKLAVACLLGLLAAILVTTTALVEGVIVFGWHPVIVPPGVSVSQGVAFARLVLATLYIAWSMTGMLAFAFFLSTVTDATIGAVCGGIGLTVTSQIMDAIPQIGRIRGFLPTHQWHAWEALFGVPPQTHDMLLGVALQVPYILVFLALAWWWFHRKDITS